MAINTDSLRPSSLIEFRGQEDLVRDISIIINSAKSRNQIPDHLLFSGPPGLGKTTLSYLIANELKMPIITTTGPSFTKPGDIASILTSINEPSVLFIDEIHALAAQSEELLYPAMEDGFIDLFVGEGIKSRSIRIDLQPFLLIGATTKYGNLSAPLRDRFGYNGRLKLYSDTEIANIVLRSSKIIGIDIDLDAAISIASRSRGTPRIANKWLKRVRDYSEVNSIDNVTSKIAEEALDSFGVDKIGLDDFGREILLSIINNFSGGPVGLSTIATSVNENTTTIEEVYEPHLIRSGMLVKTPRGREVTKNAYKHLGIKLR
jgi:Holliday junction DNA helicase RuvB